MFLAFSQSEVERRKACERVVNVHHFFLLGLLFFRPRPKILIFLPILSGVLICRRPNWDTAWDNAAEDVDIHRGHYLSQALTAGLPAKLS